MKYLNVVDKLTSLVCTDLRVELQNKATVAAFLMYELENKI